MHFLIKAVTISYFAPGGALAEENNEDEDEEKEEPIHDQVEGIIFILFKKVFESFHAISCSIPAKVRNSGRRQTEQRGTFPQKIL